MIDGLHDHYYWVFFKRSLRLPFRTSQERIVHYWEWNSYIDQAVKFDQAKIGFEQI